jgi:hypothetical protein
VKLDKFKNKDRDRFMDDKERHNKKSVRKSPRGGQREKNALKRLSPTNLDEFDDIEFE